MDPYTFGDSKACVELATILERENNQKLIEKVGRYIDKFYGGVNMLSFIPDVKIRRQIFDVWSDNFISPQSIYVMLDRCVIPTVKVQIDLNSFIRCVLKMKYRKVLKEWQKK